MKFITLGLLLLFGYFFSFAVAIKAARCDKSCRFPRGICQANGQCLCNYGWTGPNSTVSSYLTSGINAGRIVTSGGCNVACNYNQNFPNPICAQLHNGCDPTCGFPTGTCLTNGLCLCNFGWTGPNRTVSVYASTEADKGRILTIGGCNVECTYNPNFLNPECARASIGQSSCEL